MPVADRLAALELTLLECDDLIVSAHLLKPDGSRAFTQSQTELITKSAYLNQFIAWETFIEDSFADLLFGDLPISGTPIVKFANPPTQLDAKRMVVGVNKYFDYANHEFVKKISRIYFSQGHPFDSAINSIATDLADMKTIRNACAHFASSTQVALESLAQRILGTPVSGISAYTLLMSNDPRSATNGTVHSELRDKIFATATIIANG